MAEPPPGTPPGTFSETPSETPSETLSGAVGPPQVLAGPPQALLRDASLSSSMCGVGDCKAR
eukprot:6526485-Pyramimonas_sp.AAC.1